MQLDFTIRVLSDYNKYMNEKRARYYLVWTVILLIGSLVINATGLMILSFQLTQLRRDIAAFPANTAQLPSTVLGNATGSGTLTTELTSIRDELVRLRAEQRDINRILALPINPHELVTMLSDYQTSSTVSGTTKP